MFVRTFVSKFRIYSWYDWASKLYFVVADPPLWYGPTYALVELNDTVTINCSICAEPMPIGYAWYKDDMILVYEVCVTAVNLQTFPQSIKKTYTSPLQYLPCLLYL